jgi:hypothetical protein
VFQHPILAACAAFIWATSASAQIPAVGTKIGSTIDLGVRTVPLPQGIWTVASVESGFSTKGHSTTRVYLADLEQGKLWRWIYIRTNNGYSEGKWRRNKEICDRKNTHFGTPAIG